MARSARAIHNARSAGGYAYLNKPVFSVAPAITGTAQVGQTLTLSNGTASPAPTSREYIWRAAGVMIPGAVASTYQLTSGELGKAIIGDVVAIRNGVRTVASSAATAAVIA